MQGAVEVRGLSKRYGAVHALRDLELTVPRGGVFGLLGPNGAGKSTLLRIAMGMVRPSSGDIRVLGEPLHARTYGRIGGFIESPRFHPFLTGAETLDSLALTAGVARRTGELLERVELSDAADLRVDGYSLGMKQRLAIAGALIGAPELIVLDEPLNGLDPAGIIEMRSLIRSLGAQEGVTVLFSSHLLDEVERVCDRIAILNRGRLVREGRVSDLLAARATLRLRVSPIEAALAVVGGKAARNGDHVRVEIAEEEAPALIAALCAAGIAVYEAAWERPNLEALFLEETA